MIRRCAIAAAILLAAGCYDAPYGEPDEGAQPPRHTETIATLTYRMSFVEYEFGRSSALAVIGLLITTVGIVVYMKLQKQVEF